MWPGLDKYWAVGLGKCYIALDWSTCGLLTTILLLMVMQENTKSMQQQLALYGAQLTAQQRETRAAKEMLAEAESEMEAVHFEKKQLLAQWKGSLTAIQR